MAITVTAKYVNVDGTVNTGSVMIQALQRATDGSGGIISLGDPVTIALDAAGRLNGVSGVTLPNNSVGYQITEVIGPNPQTYVIPGNANIDLSSVVSTATLGLVATNYMGAWSSVTTYLQNQIVSFSGSSYIALTSSTNVTPGTDATKWGLLALAGSGFGAETNLGTKTGAFSIDATVPLQRVTISGTGVPSFTGATAGSRIDLLVLSTPPAYITWPTGTIFPGGVIPPLTGYDRFTLSYDGTNWLVESNSSTANPLGLQPGVDPTAVPFGASRIVFEAALLGLPPSAIANAGSVAAGATLISRAGVTGTVTGASATLKYPHTSTGFTASKFNPNVLPRGSVNLRTAAHKAAWAAGAFGATSPFTLIVCVEPNAQTNNGAALSLTATAAARLSIGRTATPGTFATSSASGFTNYASSASLTAPMQEAANTPTVWSILWNGTNAASNTTFGVNCTIRMNGAACTRTNGAQFDPQMSATADTITLGSDPAATWVDNPQDVLGLFWCPTLLDFSTPLSAGVAIERYFAARAGLPVNVFTAASPL